jgi:urease accessory protein
MTVPLSEIGRSGRLDLTFNARCGRTVLCHSYCEVPFKITRLHHSPSSGIAHLILMQCTAGLFGGDAVECTICVKAGAQVLITQQSATKVHPSGSRPACHFNRIRVETGGELHLYYDPVIPFSNSRMWQKTEIELDPGSRFSFWEGLMAGRAGRGEVWQFDEFSSETSVRSGGQSLYIDRFCLRPRLNSPTQPFVMGDARYLATGLLFAGAVDTFAGRLHDLLPGAGVDIPAAGLALVRVMSVDGPQFHRARDTFARLVQLHLRPGTLLAPKIDG